MNLDLAPSVPAEAVSASITIAIHCGVDIPAAAATVLSVVSAVEGRPDLDPRLVLVGRETAVLAALAAPLDGNVSCALSRDRLGTVSAATIELQAGELLTRDDLPRSTSAPAPPPPPASTGPAEVSSRVRACSPGGIPRVFHRVWLGPRDIPSRYEDYWQSWQELHTDWTFLTWRDQDLPRLINQRQFDASSTWAGKADIARYEILLRFGGVYVDCDFEALKAIDPVISDHGAFTASEDGLFASIGIMGARPSHPYFWRVVEELPMSIALQRGAAPNVQTGPHLATRTLINTPAGDRPVVFPPSLFYPYAYGEWERESGPFPEAYAVHHWGASWMTGVERSPS